MKKQATTKITESCCVAEHLEYRRYAFRETVGECAKNGRGGAFKFPIPQKRFFRKWHAACLTTRLMSE